MTIPKYKELYSNVLSLFSDQYVEYKTRFVKKTVADQLNLSFEDRNELKQSGGEPLIENRIGWAITYLKKAGLLESKKTGYVNITEEGLKLSKENPNITEDDLLKIPSFYEYMEEMKRKKHQKRVKNSITLDVFEDKENLKIAVDKINLKLSKVLIEYIEKTDFNVFYKIIKDLLINMGYSEFVLNSGDEKNIFIGIVNQDGFGLDKFAIMGVKLDKINLQSIQNFAGFMVSNGLTKGVIISSVSFDNQMIEYVANLVNLNISLINGEKLAKLMIKYDVGLFTKHILEIKSIDHNYFN